MSWFFGDGFDLYQQISDAAMGGTYWDSLTTGRFELSSTGRFAGSRGLSCGNTLSANAGLFKSSGQNDAVHHINVAIEATAGLSVSNPGFFVTFFDGATAQCSLVFNCNGTILLTSGGPTGTTLATFSSPTPISALNTWYGFECEVVIHNTAGSFTVRKNGNPSNDFSATSLNTRGGTANNYANKIGIGSYATNNTPFIIDDFLWRSDPSSVSWVGDVRCYTRLPAADASASWTRSGSTVPVTPFVQQTTGVTNAAFYSPFTAACAGTVGSAILSLSAGFTGNIKGAIFADNAGVPGSVLATSAVVNNPVLGNNTLTFSSPATVVAGAKYWFGIRADTSVSALNIAGSTVTNAASVYQSSGLSSSTIYASFPAANPSVTGAGAIIFTANITPTTAANANLVADPTQDGAGGYVYDSNVSDTDLYTLQAISGTPSSIIAVTTRLIAQKSDAGTRNIGAQLKSNVTTSNGSSVALNTTFGHVYRTDTVDPDTGAAWTATGVNNLQVGIKVTA